LKIGAVPTTRLTQDVSDNEKFQENKALSTIITSDDNLKIINDYESKANTSWATEKASAYNNPNKNCFY